MVALGKLVDELVGKGGARGGAHLVIAGVGSAVADVLEGAAGEDHRVLRHGADARAQGLQVHLLDGHAVEHDLSGRRVVPAQQQAEHRALARTTGADQGHGLPRPHGQRKVLQGRLRGARRVVKAHPFKGQRAATGRPGRLHRPRRGLNGRLEVQQFHQPLAGARGAQQVAVHLAQHGHRAGQDDDVNDGLPQVAGADLARQHGLRALVQTPQQQGRGADDDEGDQAGACPAAFDGGAEGLLGRVGKALRLAVFGGVALNDGDGVEHLGRDGAGVGHAVLAGARELAHAPAKPHAGQHHQHDDQRHLQHHVGVGPHQHDQGADAHHRVAQAHGQRRAHDGLHQGGVGGQAREDFAGLCGFEKLGALAQHMAVDRVAQVGRDALTQPADEVKARRRKRTQGDRHTEQQQEVTPQGQGLCAALGRHQAAVDQVAQRHREQQGRGRGQHQKQDGQRDLQAVGAQERDQARERAGTRGFGAFGGGADVHGRECAGFGPVPPGRAFRRWWWPPPDARGLAGAARSVRPLPP